MKIQDTKYLLAYLIPICTLFSILAGDYWSYFTVFIAFVLIPMVDLIMPLNASNLAPDERESRASKNFFTVLLYGNLFLIYGIVFVFAYRIANSTWETHEFVGMVLSTGICLGSNGINVAHELGHKQGRLAQLSAALLLLPSLYMHFTIEHNFGHHARVGTNEDPATSRYGENIFAFHWRSITQGWLSAWRIKSAQLSRMKTPLPFLQNTVLWYLVIQTAYVLVLYLVFGSQVAIGLSLAGVLGILLLETINYVEHYGLIRQKEANGRYAHVASFHSWNSDHQAGRILLYELTRHSDHHYKAHKKYQLLDHHGESPQLPFGYPASILLALVPPLWFTVMNPRVEAWQLKYGRA